MKDMKGMKDALGGAARRLRSDRGRCLQSGDIADSAIRPTPYAQGQPNPDGARFAAFYGMEIYTSELGRKVIGCAIEVHSALGPGLLESAYERCLTQEFRVSGLSFARQVPLPIAYKGTALDCGYRVDFVVQGELIVELKTVERILPIHSAQALTYLRLLHLRQAFLMNFNVQRMVDGIKSLLL